MPILPNRKCTCGFTRFRERRAPVSSEVERWVFFVGQGGVGSTPAGSGVGTGPVQWGLFDGTLRSIRLETVCESCSRVRTSVSLGGVVVFGSYVQGSSFFVVASDVLLPVTCFSLRLVGPGGETFEVPFSLTGILPPPVSLPTPVVVAPVPPTGAPTANRLLTAILPEVFISGTYSATLVDRCANTETPLTDVVLEAEPMILSPHDADLSGAPRAWLEGPGGNRPIGQVASGSRYSVPFDKCQLVVEYDARLGTLPSSQGFIHTGTGAPTDYQLIEGGALQATTVPTFPSYWTQTVPMTVNPDKVFAYTAVNPLDEGYSGVPGDGFDFTAKYASAPATAYVGVRFAHGKNRWWATRLDSSANTWVGDFDARGWSEFASAQVGTPSLEMSWRAGNNRLWSGTVFGFEGLSPGIEAIVLFGDTNGIGMISAIRNFVSSFGGRFIRAGFTAYAQTVAPIVRLYLVSDINVSPSKTARFKINYGSGDGPPYGSLPYSAEATVNFVVPNSVYEVPFNLPGLTANQPFWMTVERVWNHVDDKVDATVHLLQASVRVV